MAFRCIVFLCLFLATPLHAQQRVTDLTDLQPSYTRIAAKCGEDADRPSFSSAEYVGALADAAKALRTANKSGSKEQRQAIQNSVTRLKECQKEEKRKFIRPKMTNCREFLNGINAFAAWSAPLIKSGTITTADRDRFHEDFRPAAQGCVREMMSRCIDPNKTSNVDFAVDVINAATVFGFIFTYKNKTGFDRFLTTNGSMYLRMSFCTDTDFSCKGDKAACGRRITQIKAIMETYIER
jgi:hypothetical protein